MNTFFFCVYYLSQQRNREYDPEGFLCKSVCVCVCVCARAWATCSYYARPGRAFLMVIHSLTFISNLVKVHSFTTRVSSMSTTKMAETCIQAAFTSLGGIPGRLRAFWALRQIAKIWICGECHIQRNRKRRHRHICSRSCLRPSWRISRLYRAKPAPPTVPELRWSFLFSREVFILPILVILY